MDCARSSKAVRAGFPLFGDQTALKGRISPSIGQKTTPGNCAAVGASLGAGRPPPRARAPPTGIIARDSLTTGARLQGPAVVVERETSTVVTAPFDVVMQSDGSLLMLRKEIV